MAKWDGIHSFYLDKKLNVIGRKTGDYTMEVSYDPVNVGESATIDLRKREEQVTNGLPPTRVEIFTRKALFKICIHDATIYLRPGSYYRYDGVLTRMFYQNVDAFLAGGLYLVLHYCWLPFEQEFGC